MQNIELYFDGYCPESLLKGEHIEMKLNQDDFWESVSTGLQIAVFPPHAAILRWRGEGKFRESSDVASNVLSGLVMTEASIDLNREFFPDTNRIIPNGFELENYLDHIYENKKSYKESLFDANDPKLEMHAIYLSTIAPSKFQELGELFETLKQHGLNDDLGLNKYFNQLHDKVYSMNLIFDFNWPKWNQGWRNIENANFDYSDSSLLELSMYLTAIFRSDRFSEGSILYYWENGTLQKIFAAVQKRFP